MFSIYLTRSDGKRDIVDDYRPQVVYPRKANANALKELLEELRRDALAHVDYSSSQLSETQIVCRGSAPVPVPNHIRVNHRGIAPTL